MALSDKHVREIKKLVDEHAMNGDLTLSKDMENALSFSPTPQEIDFLRRYTAWRLEHSLTGIAQ